jgi:hypothetical protein
MSIALAAVLMVHLRSIDSSNVRFLVRKRNVCTAATTVSEPKARQPQRNSCTVLVGSSSIPGK